MDPWNNYITYDEKWDTPENQKALKELENRYFNKSGCRPDCPISWAKEVLEMFNNIERELGFKHNTSTMRGYCVQGTPKDWFMVNPWKSFFTTVRYNFFGDPHDRGSKLGTKARRERVKRSAWNRVKAVVKDTFHPVKYGLRALKIIHINPILNHIQNRKVDLAQLKEKFGYLTVYYQCPDAYKGFVEKEIKKCAIKLAMKGAYWPIESLWDAGVSYNIENEYEPDSVKVEESEYNGERTVKLTKTTYRKVMKELGLDLKEIENKATLRKASKVDPV